MTQIIGRSKTRLESKANAILNHGDNFSEVQEIDFIGLETLVDIGLMVTLSALGVLITRLRFEVSELSLVTSTRIYLSTIWFRRTLLSLGETRMKSQRWSVISYQICKSGENGLEVRD